MITLREAAQNVVDALIKNPTRVSKEVHIASVVLREVLAQPEQDDGYCQACEGNHCTAKNGCVALDNPRAQPEQEPVAWTLLLTGEHHGIVGKAGEAFVNHPEHYMRVNVYTAPPQRECAGTAHDRREWQGLTDEEGDAILDTLPFGYSPAQFYLAIEAKLKEKNAC